MTVQAPARVAIIGCGLIGSQWDQGPADTVTSRTHAAAFSQNPGSQLVALCDRDPAVARSEAAKWGCVAAFSDPQALFSQIPVDIAVVATSTAARLEVLEPAIHHGVRLFVIEKPLAATLAESEQIMQLLERCGARTLVNYSRRWDRSVREMRTAILAGTYGRIQRLVGLYGKGLVNNGSHMVDLAGYLLAARPVRARALGSPLREGEAGWSLGKDPALDAQLVFADGVGAQHQMDLLGTDQSAFTCFDLRIILEDAQIEFLQGGRTLQVTRLQQDPRFPNYTVLAQPHSAATELAAAMKCMADEAIGLARHPALHASCSARDALATARAVEAVLASQQDGGRWIELAHDEY